ncbi:MBL fold metallo-hydrolase, partial [candidate division KSB1 bacterium]
ILNHLISKKYREIEYIFLSHPHFDHYSGFPQLLDYCTENNIKIKHFFHTCRAVYDYIKVAVKTVEAAQKITYIFKVVKKLSQETELEENYIEANKHIKIPIQNGVYLEILSPSSKEVDKYLATESYPFEKEEQHHNNPRSNLLSLILKLSGKDWYLLLTSDAEKWSLIRLGTKEKHKVKGKLLLGQSSHHGSFHNHNNDFWRKRERETNTPIFFSAGTNIYNHPHKSVVSFFVNQQYDIYSTNRVGGLTSISDHGKHVSRLLDLISNKTQKEKPSKFSGNQTFEINNGNIKYLPV